MTAEGAIGCALQRGLVDTLDAGIAAGRVSLYPSTFLRKAPHFLGFSYMEGSDKTHTCAGEELGHTTCGHCTARHRIAHLQMASLRRVS